MVANSAAGAELCWEHNIFELAAHFRVVARGFAWDSAGTAKVHDFIDGKARRLRHLARFCEQLGVQDGVFVGNSMGRGDAAQRRRVDMPTASCQRARSSASAAAALWRTTIQLPRCSTMTGPSTRLRRILDALFDGQYWANRRGVSAAGDTKPVSHRGPGKRWQLARFRRPTARA